MSKYFSHITISEETKGTLEMIPIHFYDISDHRVQYVALYRLQFISSNPDVSEIKADIPYYISDGGTNKLRANMLYPFMCYSSINEAATCPYDTSRDRNPGVYGGLLLKYNTPGNINIAKLEEALLNTFLAIYPKEIGAIQEKIRRKSHQDNDLISVLERITNMIDFIICISNEVIANFDYSTEQEFIDRGKYRPFSMEQKKMKIDYTDLSIFGQETFYGRIQSDEYNSSSPFNNHFRLVILTILNQYYKLFSENHIIHIEQRALEPQRITVEAFNRIVNICDKETAKINMKNYKIISNAISDILSEKIEKTALPAENKVQLQSIMKHITPPSTHVSDDEMYNQLLTNWNATCLSRSANMDHKNVFQMNVVEMCQEFPKYSDLLLSAATKEQINRNCDDATSEKNPEMRLKILRDRLLYVRNQYIANNYVGQLTIMSDTFEKPIKVDVDSAETISAIKTKIFQKVGVEPQKQHLILKQQFGSDITHLENDRTIASYKIPNNSILKLSIK